MLLSRKIRTSSLSQTCRSLATQLRAGVPVLRAVKTQSESAADSTVRFAMAKILADVNQGLEIGNSMHKQGNVFPPLMINMVRMGEQTGNLPEVLASLADHYDNMIRLRKAFTAAIAWPIFQFVVAVLVIALLLFILGMIAEMSDSTPVDFLGPGMVGTRGAVLWLCLTFGSVGLAFLIYKIISISGAGRGWMSDLLLAVPTLGPAQRALAMARFAWSFHLTQEAGMPIDQSISASMEATGNPAFMSRAPQVNAALMEGVPLTESLARTRLFTREFLEISHVGETSGTVPEVLNQISPQLEAEAQRKLQMLAAVVGWTVWAFVAGFIIFLIFSIANWYMNQLNNALDSV